MQNVFDVLLITFDLAIKQFYSTFPREHLWRLNLFVLILSVFVLGVIIWLLVHPIYKMFVNYLNHRKKSAQYRLANPGAYAWGNSILRAPLLLIGTEIYSFARLSVKGKVFRYLKAAAVIIPVFWAAMGMTIFISGSKTDFSTIDLYFSCVPVLLICFSILVIDISIINAKEKKLLVLFRCLSAVIMGYVFSSIPLNYFFKASIDSYLQDNDSQRYNIESRIDEKVNTLKNEDWYKLWISLTKRTYNLSEQMEDERLGKGISKKPNDSGPNPRYNEIKSEYHMVKRNLSDFEVQHSEQLQMIKLLTENKAYLNENFPKWNALNHIKRHNALWSYAFSNLGTAIYFLSILFIFWLIDSLAVITSFIDEKEYENLRKEFIKVSSEAFTDGKIDQHFVPVAVPIYSSNTNNY